MGHPELPGPPARPRPYESTDPVIDSRHFERSYKPEPTIEPEPMIQREPKFEPDMPAAFQIAEPASLNQSQGEVISLDSMRVPPPSYTPDDLDVQAFRRKRSEVM